MLELLEIIEPEVTNSAPLFPFFLRFTPETRVNPISKNYRSNLFPNYFDEIRKVDCGSPVCGREVQNDTDDLTSFAKVGNAIRRGGAGGILISIQPSIIANDNGQIRGNSSMNEDVRFRGVYSEFGQSSEVCSQK